jgi:hypothetical protein
MPGKHKRQVCPYPKSKNVPAFLAYIYKRLPSKKCRPLQKNTCILSKP